MDEMARSRGVDVCFHEDMLRAAPHCPHGNFSSVCLILNLVANWILYVDECFCIGLQFSFFPSEIKILQRIKYHITTYKIAIILLLGI